ncbi:MAG: aldose 1-epimerase [Acidobacteriota bacterium]|nr:aldose 1-epimerase [Acidobacteriota bacterium]
MTRVSAVVILPLMSASIGHAANYSAQKTSLDGVDVVRLTDAARKVQVSIATSIGNIAYEMKVNGKNALWTPFQSLSEFAAQPALGGVPFLAPWANRLDQPAFYANGKKYRLNPDLGNLRLDGNQLPIHGLLTFSKLWKVMEAQADDRSAHVTSHLEFWRYPELMAQFPFAHTIEMTYRLADGVLEVQTALRNHALEAMPVSIGYHPYFQVHDAPRDQWKVHLAAREILTLSKTLIPTGESKPMSLPDPLPLKGTQLDTVFGGLVRGADDRAEFWVQGNAEKVSVIYGPKYTVAVSYAPPGKDFICFEPMTALTNGMNLAHSGVYKNLQSVAPGSEWRESFWIRTSGF